MKKLLYPLALLLCLYSCNNDGEKKASEAANGVPAIRNFIRYTMDGDYDKAKSFMLADSQNTAELEIYERYYNEKMKPEEKINYKSASINIHEVKNVNDSTTIVFYSNTFFKKDTHQLKSVRLDGKWLVDFKSYFQSKNDSLP